MTLYQVGWDRKVSFMRSYPDLIPLDRSTVEHIASVLEPWPFEPIYGAWWDRILPVGGKAVLAIRCAATSTRLHARHATSALRRRF